MREVPVAFGGEHAVALRGPKLRNASQKLGDDWDQLRWCQVHAKAPPRAAGEGVRGPRLDPVVCDRYVDAAIEVERLQWQHKPRTRRQRDLTDGHLGEAGPQAGSDGRIEPRCLVDKCADLVGVAAQ